MLEQTTRNLLYVAKEVETLRPAELVKHSPEFAAATKHLDYLIEHSQYTGILRLRIGERALSGLCRDFENDSKGELRRYPVEPGEQYGLMNKTEIPVEPFSLNPVAQPYYGDLVYFDIPTIGMALQDGGELRLIRAPDSSSST